MKEEYTFEEYVKAGICLIMIELKINPLKLDNLLKKTKSLNEKIKGDDKNGKKRNE